MGIKVHLKLLFLFVFLSIVNIYAEKTRPEKIYSIRKAMYPAEWYIEQAKLWQREIDKNPKDSEAWLNYYRATRYAILFSPEKKRGDGKTCSKIVQDMEKQIETIEKRNIGQTAKEDSLFNKFISQYSEQAII